MYFFLQTQCSLQSFKLASLNWRGFVDRDAILIYLGFVVVQVVLALIPIGQQVDGPPMKGGRQKVRTNGKVLCFYLVADKGIKETITIHTNFVISFSGFFAVVSTLAILGVLVFSQVNVDIVYQKYIPICAASLLFGVFLSAVLYIVGGRAAVSSLNPDGNTGHILSDFIQGRQVAPVLFGRLNVKFILHRISLLAQVSCINQKTSSLQIFSCKCQSSMLRCVLLLG